MEQVSTSSLINEAILVDSCSPKAGVWHLRMIFVFVLSFRSLMLSLTNVGFCLRVVAGFRVFFAILIL
jgi:hypothetical protein